MAGVTGLALARPASGTEDGDTGAAAGPERAAFWHPLLDEAAAARAWTDSSLSAEELYRELHVFDSVQVDASGVETVRSSFELRTVEVDDTAGDTGVATASTGAMELILDDQVEAWLDTPPDSDELLDLWIGLDRVSWNPVVSVEHELAIAMLEGRRRRRGHLDDGRGAGHRQLRADGPAADLDLLPQRSRGVLR